MPRAPLEAAGGNWLLQVVLSLILVIIPKKKQKVISLAGFLSYTVKNHGKGAAAR